MLILIQVVVVCIHVYGQDKTADSLLNLIKAALVDTNKVKLLHELSRHYLYDNPEKSIQYGRKAASLAHTLNYQKGVARAYQNIGVVYYYGGNYDSAIFYFKSSLKLKIQIGDIKGTASSYNNIGAILTARGNDEEGLQYYLNALKIYEELKDDEGAMSACNNVGNVLAEQNNHDGAMKYYRLSLNHAIAVQDDKGIGDAYHNIGSAHYDVKQRDSAIIYYRKAVKLYQKVDSKDRIANAYGSIGEWHYEGGRKDSAEIYLERSYKINSEIENKEGLANILQTLGKLYMEKKDYRNAELLLKDGLQMAIEVGLKEYEANYYKILATLYAEQSDFSKAYDYRIKYSTLKDSLISESSTRQIAELNARYESVQKEQQIALLNKDKELQASDLKKQQAVIISVVIGLVLSVLLIFSVFRSLKITRQQKSIIETQKQMVEEKNASIIDSINYAKRIQLALLKEQDHVSEHLPEHFILYKPKDIVSGDFYWAIEKGKYWYVAVADCTGHGVPGAFMCMLGVAFLNEISADHNAMLPSEILDRLRNRIVKELGQTGDESFAKDGMDISLARLDRTNDQLEWSGANNPLYVLRDQQITEYKPNKQPIGYYMNMSPFTNHSIRLEKGDMLYFFTDGIADQFGGPNGKKFKYSRFKEILSACRSQKMEDQREVLNRAIEEWKGSYEQTDDICVIGVRV
ncbi:MAG: hypothetical protein Fur0041_15580 [Bacteroidia bacterium]